MAAGPRELSTRTARADITHVRARVVVVCAALSALLLASLGMTAVPGEASSPLRSHVKLGAWVKGMVADPSTFSAVEQQVGRRFDIASYFYGYGDWFPTDVERTFADGGRRDVLISWDMGDTRFSDWTAGRHDDYLRTIGRLAASYPYPLYVRPWPEMNGDWQTFMPTASGDRPNGGTPEEFRAAWRHVVTTVRTAGGTNVKWVFNPYAATYQGTADVRTLWPGRQYVDVLGIDGYNWGGGPAPWQSFDAVFSPMYAILTSLDPDLPVWICEFASREPGVDDGWAPLPGASKAQWITDAFTTTAFPRVSALVWFHEKKERDWRIDSSTGSLAAFREQAALIGAAPAPTPTPTATPKKKKPRSALRVVSATATRVVVSVHPTMRTHLHVTTRGPRGWRMAWSTSTRPNGRAVLRRSAEVLRIVAPRLHTSVLIPD